MTTATTTSRPGQFTAQYRTRHGWRTMGAAFADSWRIAFDAASWVAREGFDARIVSCGLGETVLEIPASAD